MGKEIAINICDLPRKGKSNLRERTKLILEMLGKGDRKGKERKKCHPISDTGNLLGNHCAYSTVYPRSI